MTTRLTNRTERLILMEQLLFRSAAGLRAVEIAEACGVDRRTVYRDLSLLGDIGVPVYQKEGRFCLEREHYLATIRLSFDETMALLLTASMTRDSSPHLTSAMAKLSQALPDPAADPSLPEISSKVSADSARSQILDTITHAWAEQRCIKLWYRTRSEGKLRAREVAVYFVEPKPDGSVLVVGYDGLTERVRAFKLNRIERAKMLQTTYKLPFHFDTKKYLFYLRDAAKGTSAHSGS